MRSGLRRIRLESEKKFRTGQNVLQRRFDTAIERMPGTALAVKTQQHVDIGVFQRTAVRRSSERRQDFSRTWFFVGGSSGLAGKNLSPRGRIACTGRREWTIDGQPVYRRVAGNFESIDG